MSKKKKAQTQGSEKDKTKKPPQTNQPYEQDVKRRIGHFSGAGEPPLMKK